MLTPHQLEKREEVLSLFKQGHRRVILQGAAGVGKTYLVSELVKDFIRDYELNTGYNNGMIYITAPTNKAMAILQGKVEDNKRFIFKTVHSALNMKLNTNAKTGERLFIQAWSRPDRARDFKDCKICVIDEASMVNTEILKLLEQYSFPILFVGDKYQINPVKEMITPVFNQDWPVVELAEIIRQGAGNPIIDLSRNLDIIPFKMPKIIEGKGYIFDDNKEALIDNLAQVNGTDELKYLSWMNTDLDAMNTLVRQRIYGTPKRVEKEEVLVFNAPLDNYYINKEVKVHDLKIITDYVLVPKANTRFVDDSPINMDRIKMKYYLVNDSFRIVHEHSDLLFKTTCTTLKENCSKYGWNWKGFYYFSEQFADIKYNHAISVHKSQGSTYQKVIINIQNINFNKSAEEKQRLLYTAVTRASDLVILNKVR